METEAEVMAFKPRFACNYSELPEARKDAPLSDSEGSWPCWHLDFRLLATRTVKQNILVVLSYMVYGTLYQQPQETNSEPHKDSCMREKQMDPVSSFNLGNSGTHRQTESLPTRGVQLKQACEDVRMFEKENT